MADGADHARILVFDSGLGGLSVLRALQACDLKAHYVYAADNAAFPYGDWREDELKARIIQVMAALIEAYEPDLIVIACNTASTLALESLREAFDVPFVGTVPAIRVAARQSKTRVIGVLATPGTAKRGYTHELIDEFAGDCHVVLCPSDHLAEMAEARLAGMPVDMAQLAQEIAPAFVTFKGARTDVVVLACTHYPFLLDELQKAAPWPVEFIDPAPAIARRTAEVLAGVDFKPGEPEIIQNQIMFTRQLENIKGFAQLFDGFGLSSPETITINDV